MASRKVPGFNPIKEKIHEIIFEADTPLGKAFDVVLMVLIIASVIVVMLESVTEINTDYKTLFIILEWVFTIFFSIEYGLRIYCVYRPWKYITSFFGIIDLLAIVPSFLSLILPGAQYLLTIRAMRLLRVFRIFKLVKFLAEGSVIIKALKASRAKITVFIVFILLMVVIVGSVMYLIEGGVENSGFTSIPRSVYWAIVTLTTVGYGDIAPKTEVGQFLAAIVMILGYAVIAVPTGIVSSEIITASGERKPGSNLPVQATNTQVCRFCTAEGHDDDALYCNKCGEILNEE